jgi:hypothetical protein
LTQKRGSISRSHVLCCLFGRTTVLRKDVTDRRQNPNVCAQIQGLACAGLGSALRIFKQICAVVGLCHQDTTKPTLLAGSVVLGSILLSQLSLSFIHQHSSNRLQSISIGFLSFTQHHNFRLNHFKIYFRQQNWENNCIKN